MSPFRPVEWVLGWKPELLAELPTAVKTLNSSDVMYRRSVASNFIVDYLLERDRVDFVMKEESRRLAGKLQPDLEDFCHHSIKISIHTYHVERRRPFHRFKRGRESQQGFILSGNPFNQLSWFQGFSFQNLKKSCSAFNVLSASECLYPGPYLLQVTPSKCCSLKV